MLAAQLSLPTPKGVAYNDVRSVFSAADMPSSVRDENTNRFVPTRVTIRPDGTSQSCTVDKTSGDADVDAYTCAIIVRRAKFQPATWSDGSPAYGVLRSNVAWIAGPTSKDETEKAFPADLKLVVKGLPTAAGTRADLDVAIAVDEHGKIVGCVDTPKNSRRDHAKYFTQFLPVACQRLTDEFTAVPAIDQSGKQVRSIQNAAVAFIVTK